MKTISDHLGQIIAALAAVAILITSVVFFKAPIGDFFGGIVDKETSIGDNIVANMDEVDLVNLNDRAESLLPDEYQQVECIESTGTQWIDTGFIPNQNTTVTFDRQMTKIAGGSAFGVRQGWSIAYRDLNSTSEGKCKLAQGPAVGLGYMSLDTERHLIERNTSIIYADGKSCIGFQQYTFTCHDTLYLFAVNVDNTGAEGFINMKLYSFKLYDNGTLVRDFYPCYRKKDKEAGLFDLVNGVFYENQGTGEFKIPDE